MAIKEEGLRKQMGGKGDVYHCGSNDSAVPCAVALVP